MDNNINYNEKSQACIKQFRRAFLLTSAFVLFAMAFMYGSTEDTYLSRTMSLTRLGNWTIFNITQGSLEKLSKSLTYQSVNKLRYLEASADPQILNTAQASLSGNNRTTLSRAGQSSSLEYPGMPDPCSQPRRFTGVEDILCMKRPQFLSNFKNPCWKVDGKLKCIGYFHLFGICKSGTSDFFKRLYLHPDIVPNRGIFGKEIWYWSWKRLWLKPRGGLLYQGMTFEEFTRQFQDNIINQKTIKNDYHPQITGHGDPMDIWDEFNWKLIPQNDPKASEPTWTTPYFVHHMNPNVKLFLMLRDPVERLFSHYLHSGAGSSAKQFHLDVQSAISRWKECVSKNTQRHCVYDSDFKKSVKAPIYTSFYDIHIKEWLKVFPREQIFIFRNEDYSKDIKGTFIQVFKFLDIDIPPDSTLEAMQNLPHFHATQKKKTAGNLQQKTKDLLVELYRPHLQELAKILKDDRFLWKDQSFS